MMEEDIFDTELVNKEQDYKTLCNLVEEMTTTGKKDLDTTHLKSLKNTTKKSEQNVRHTYRLLMTQLGKYHAEIRFSALQLINEFFRRSHQFRVLLLDDLHRFFELTVDKSKDTDFPPPFTVARELQSLALAFISKWDEEYGEAYQKLRLGCNYLKRVKKVEFADLRSQTEIQRRQQAIEERREEVIVTRKVEYVLRKMAESQTEIESCIIQAENCLRLLVPDFEEDTTPLMKSTENSTLVNKVDEDEVLSDRNTLGPQKSQGFTSNKLKTNQTEAVSVSDDGPGYGSNIGINNMSYEIAINFTPSHLNVLENDDNKDIIKNLSDLHNDIVKHHLPAVKQWINILTKAQREYTHLQKAMEIKGKLLQVFDKYNELNIISEKQKEPTLIIKRDLAISDDDSSETDDFEEVPENPMDNSQTSISSGNQVQFAEKDIAEDSLPGPSHGRNNFSGSSMKMGLDASNGGQEHAGSDFLENNNSKKTTTWSCRASLPGGLLCERKDLLKCPFHGRIVPRNSFGIPSKEEDLESDAKKRRALEQKSLADLQRDIQSAKGILLSSDMGRKKIRTARYARLTNPKESRNTSRNRLEEKVLSKKRWRKVAESLDLIDNRRNLENYGCNFNYQ